MSQGTSTSQLKRGQSTSAHKVPEQSEWECRTHECVALTPHPTRKKPGGQPGNTNALKLKRTQSASA